MWTTIILMVLYEGLTKGEKTMDNKGKIDVQAKGHNGPIDFELSIDDGRVTDLEIKQHSEIPGIFDQVADKLRSDVLENQSFAIDAISGATVMSEAILESADQAVKNEGVQLPEKEKEQTRQKEEIQVDIVVIGGGEAGLVAAARLLTAGKKVALLEKNGYLGGATILNGSNVTATGSKTAKRIFGEQAKKDTPQHLAADVSNESLHTNDQNLTQVMTENIGEAIDFISDFVNLNYGKAQTQTPEHSIDRQIELSSSSSYELVKKAAEAFTKKGGQIFLDARVEHILQDENGKVTGVVAEGRKRTLTVHADAITLSTGGYGANLNMRGKKAKG